jgi:hypothetical protein
MCIAACASQLSAFMQGRDNGGRTGMRRKRLGPFLMRIGLIGLGVATVWWIIFYTCEYQALGINDLPPVQCLLSNTGTCGVASGIANVAGYLAYDPLLFWLGGIACIIGNVMSNSAKV